MQDKGSRCHIREFRGAWCGEIGAGGASTRAGGAGESQCTGMRIQSSPKVKEMGCTGTGRGGMGGSTGPQCLAKGVMG